MIYPASNYIGGYLQLYICRTRVISAIYYVTGSFNFYLPAEYRPQYILIRIYVPNIALSSYIYYEIYWIISADSLLAE